MIKENMNTDGWSQSRSQAFLFAEGEGEMVRTVTVKLRVNKLIKTFNKAIKLNLPTLGGYKIFCGINLFF